MSKATLAVIAASLALAGSAGFLTSTAFSGSSQATRTVTINLTNGATGPAGPKGERGPTGPSGEASCPAGFEPGDLVINHPGGQVTVFTCLKTP
jgi:hypothetical protein